MLLIKIIMKVMQCLLLKLKGSIRLSGNKNRIQHWFSFKLFFRPCVIARRSTHDTWVTKYQGSVHPTTVSQLFALNTVKYKRKQIYECHLRSSETLLPFFCMHTRENDTLLTKARKAIEYDQEIPRSLTADKPRGKAT